MISPVIIALMRSWVLKTLTDTCTIYRESGDVDEFGAVRHDLIPTGGAIQCRLLMGSSKFKGEAKDSAMRDTLANLYRLVLPYGTTIDTSYMVGIPDADGDVYGVVAIENHLTSQPTVTAILERHH